MHGVPAFYSMSISLFAVNFRVSVRERGRIVAQSYGDSLSGIITTGENPAYGHV